MALNADQLAQALLNTMSPKVDGKGMPVSSTAQVKAYAAGIVSCLQSAIVSNAPGTIVGVTAPGAPLTAGAGTGGIMVITPSALQAQTATAFVGAKTIAAENTAIITYIGTGLIVFPTGGIVGTCTNTPTSPGPLTAGTGTGGMIVGLTGAAALGAVAPALGTPGPAAVAFYNALITYILSSAQATYGTGTVQGVCPPGGGPLTAGSASGGTIS
jgi:hypothetical protein